MRRHADELKSKKCKIKDIKRHTWCTYEHFSNMYDGAYEGMVEAGVAVKLEEEVMYDKFGEITTDKSKRYGRPTKYKLTHPEEILFVDETGCNTNMREDGHVGGETFALPAKDDDCGRSGATTDIHFSVLCFTNGVGDPVLCAIILKSAKDIDDVPVTWKVMQYTPAETREDFFKSKFWKR
jgi:hypothetical protein